MTNQSSASPNRWVRSVRKIYNPLGFKHGYNFPLFVIFTGALMGFTLAKLQYLSINGIFREEAIPSDSVTYQRPGHIRVGVIMHLVCILPAAFLACFQFVPVIRYKALLFHRLNGYVVSLFLTVSTAGAYMITPTAAGGAISTQIALGILGASTMISMVIAIISIKRLRIDLHREWMIRTWVYAGSVVSQRLLLAASGRALRDNASRGWYDVQTCKSIEDQYELVGVPRQANVTQQLYPACVDPTASVVVNAIGAGPENGSATVHLTFGAAMWLALTLHFIGVEIYFRFTQAESERLRQVSAERRAERGMMREDVAKIVNYSSDEQVQSDQPSKQGQP